jgi:hypothetical protein
MRRLKYGGPLTGAKLKTPEPSRKKSRRSGKREREAREVDAPLVDLDLGEVGVHRERGAQLGVML